jgi:DNA-binding NtrC family response regulator
MAKSSNKLNILYGEGDADVLAEQAKIIANAGHQVKTAEGRKGVLEALKAGGFDLLILGPTLSRDDRHHLPYMAKKHHQGTRVLVMHTDGSRHPYVDANLDTGCSMESLIEKIASTFGVKAAAAGAGR